MPYSWQKSGQKLLKTEESDRSGVFCIDRVVDLPYDLRSNIKNVVRELFEQLEKQEKLKERFDEFEQAQEKNGEEEKKEQFNPIKELKKI